MGKWELKESESDWEIHEGEGLILDGPIYNGEDLALARQVVTDHNDVERLREALGYLAVFAPPAGREPFVMLDMQNIARTALVPFTAKEQDHE